MSDGLEDVTSEVAEDNSSDNGKLYGNDKSPAGTASRLFEAKKRRFGKIADKIMDFTSCSETGQVICIIVAAGIPQAFYRIKSEVKQEDFCL